VTVDLSMSALVNPRILISAYQATIQWLGSNRKA
jgi:hypothetical protein